MKVVSILTSLCLVKGLLDLRRFVLVLRDLPTSVQFFHDQINAVILHQRVVHDDLCCSPALAFELSQKPSPPAGSSATMRLPARVEDRVSIVGMCTPVLALRNLEVGPVQTVVPLLCPHQFFPIVLPWFRPTPGSATNCGSSVSESCTKSTVS